MNNQMTYNNNGGNNQVPMLQNIENNMIEKIKVLENEGITFPDNYNPKNAIVSAMYKISQDKNLMACTQTSIEETLLGMLTMGLDVQQTQCYFIPYGNKCTLHMSYFGKQTVLKRINGINDIVAQPIFEGDTIDYGIVDGNITNLEHKTSFMNRNKKIIGAYAIIELNKHNFGREQHIEVMTIEEIKLAWGMGATKGNSKAHNNFPQEMAKRTVINRVAKNFVNTLTDDRDKKIASEFNKSVNNEYMDEKKKNAQDVDVVTDERLAAPSEEDKAKIKEVQNEIKQLFDQLGKLTQQTAAELFRDYQIKGNESLEQLESIKSEILDDLMEAEAQNEEITARNNAEILEAEEI